MRVRILSSGLALLLAACSRGPAPVAPTPAAVAEPDTARREIRWAARPVPVPPSFQRAVDEGSRTLDGRPGPRYWQQRVAYRIDAELDPRTGRLQAEERVTYHNRSPDTLHVVVFNLYQNLFRAGEPRNEPVPVTDGLVLERLAIAGAEARRIDLDAEPPSGRATYHLDGTLMVAHLPRPLAPGDSVEFQVAWRFTVPPADAPRTGRSDHAVYQVAQWYPQIAVYDDLRGWNADPYLGTGEFYLEYGDFDVALTLPEGWLVAATGTLENPDEVLTDMTRERLSIALRSDSVVRVVGPDDLDADNATQRVPGGQLTWRFQARDVRDFAFAASDRYVWDATRAIIADSAARRADTVAVHAFYRPGATAWRQAARYTRHAVTYFSRIGHRYIYPHITSTEGPVYGMEYPMIVFVADIEEPGLLYTVIAHEVAHQWYPMMVGSDEKRHAWQDEGLASYLENLALADMAHDGDVWGDELSSYMQVAGTELEKPMMREADLYGPGPAYGVASYSKPALLMRALAHIIGPDALRVALREYSRRWLLKHPTPLDFFNTVEDVAGRDLDWFWHPWWYETAVLDQAIADVEIVPAAEGERVAITVEDRGDAPMPVLLAVTLENGETRRVTVPVDVWLEGARRHRVELSVPGRVQRVEIDPEDVLLDVDRTNDAWVRGAQQR